MSELNKLAKCQKDLNLTAAGVLLHNIGKVSRQFLEKKLGSGGSDFLYQHILGLIYPYCENMPSELWDGCTKLVSSDILESRTKTALSSNSIHLPFPFNDREYVPGDMIEFLGQREPWYTDFKGKLGILHLFPEGSRLTHLVNRAHRGASGGEKEDVWTQNQSKDDCLFIATPFGWEISASGINSIDELRFEIERTVCRYLFKSEAPFSFRQFAKDLYPHLNQAIADTRRPLNDVTVWDIGHTATAFHITQALSKILINRPLEHVDLIQTKEDNKLFWRVLSVRTNALRYLEEANTLGDLRVRKRLLSQALERVQSTLEESLLAIQVYRDENGSFYIFPDFENRSESILMAIRSTLNSLVEIDGRIFKVKLNPNSLSSHPKDKGGKYVGDFIQEELCKALDDDYDPIHIAKDWMATSHFAEACIACGIRPQGYGAESVPSYRLNPVHYSSKAGLRNLCCPCMNWRSGVAEQWITCIRNHVDNGTIWTDEVADRNGRIALIVGQWPIEYFMRGIAYPNEDSSKEVNLYDHNVQWIGRSPADGSYLQINKKGKFYWSKNVLRGEQRLEHLKMKMNKIPVFLTSKPKDPVDFTLRGFKFDPSGDLLLEVNEDLLTRFNLQDQIKVFGENVSIAESHALKMDNKLIEKIFWCSENHLFFVKNSTKVFQTQGTAATNASFARLRRIWETTRDFWQEICPTSEDDSLAQSLIGAEIGNVGPRLRITPRHADDLDLGDYHVYSMVLSNNARMSVVWDTENKHFVTCDNLDYLGSKDQLGQMIIDYLSAGTVLTIEEPTGYGSKDKVWGKILVEDVCEIPDSTYIPVMPILAEPRTFMVLVPAEKAFNIAKAIKIKYEREMGKVRNRLPLHLGIVYAGRRTPFRSILDAGRRMSDQSFPAENWRIVDVTQKSTDKSDRLPEQLKMEQFREWLEVQLERDDRRLIWRIPAMMGDGKTIDQWYPYIFLNTRCEPTNRDRYFHARNPLIGQDGWFIHAGDLQRGDDVYFTPATLDFQWLDSAGRRFEIAYDEKGQRRDLPRRPYLLDELETLEEIWVKLKCRLPKNQIYILRDLIEGKRVDWQIGEDGTAKDEFKQFCRDALANAEWKNGKPPWENKSDMLDHWADYAARGWIADAIELHLQIMKEKVD